MRGLGCLERRPQNMNSRVADEEDSQAEISAKRVTWNTFVWSLVWTLGMVDGTTNDPFIDSGSPLSGGWKGDHTLSRHLDSQRDPTIAAVCGSPTACARED